MELLLRICEDNKIKRETSIFQLEYLNEIQTPNSKEILVFDGLELNLIERIVYLNKKQIAFTAKEFDILAFLVSHPNQVFSHKQIYEAVWKNEYFCDEANIISHIGHIRKKIESNPRQPVFIQTVRGVGYKFVKK